ncbi:sugar ABC transporter permease [Terrarubrum flagellatum]|uniref:carbohydrate ABC transporter permease n=1 Tax=Terrirubrum flagellatum TaxID=2895980 RepID=UPI00314548A7
MSAISGAVSDNRRALPFVAPALILIGAVILLPAFYVLYLSFNESTFGRAPTFVGFANYARILADPYFWRALLNTAVVVLIVVHVELALALGMALLFASGLPFRKWLIAAVLAPYAVSEVGAVVMWRTIFDPDAGVMTRLLESLGLPTLEWSVWPSHGLALVAILSIWLHLPFTFIILYAARLGLPAEIYEAARIDGAGPLQIFRRVTFPLLIPAMLVAMLFRYIFAFRLFSEVWLLTQGGPARTTEVVAVYLYLEAFRYNNFGVATATGWLMVLASLLLASFYLRRIYKEMFARGE